MPLDVSKFVEKKKKRNCFHTIKYLWLLYWRTLLDFWRKYRKIIKDLFKQLFTIPLILIVIFIIYLLFATITSYFEKNFYYSIPEPKIMGEFRAKKADPFITINGIEKIVGEETASLAYAELTCYLPYNDCWEKRYSILNLSGVMMFPYQNNFTIKYKDKNKVLFATADGRTTGEIDLNMKTLFYVSTGSLNGQPKKTQIVTDDKEIDKIKKHIIRKYLRQGIKWW